jgi:predicted nuclease of restriction endonuclease-like (RecB) superfamily
MTDPVMGNPPPERGIPHPATPIGPDAHPGEDRYFPCMSDHRNGTGGDPAGYGDLLDAVTREITGSRARAVLAADAELIRQYWRIGRHILDRQPDDDWAAVVAPRLSADLRAAFPEASAYSRTNLLYMTAFAAAWPECVPETGRPLPWGHHVVLLDMPGDRTTREFYARKAADEGWTRGVLITMIKGRFHLRAGHCAHDVLRAAPQADRRGVHRMIRDPHSPGLPDETARQERGAVVPY